MTDRADFPALGNRFLIRSEQTDGRFALVEHTIAPRALAAPTHTHQHEDEYSFVLSGRMGAMIGDEVISPGGFEQYFADMAPLLNTGGPPDVAALLEVQQCYGLSMDINSREELSRRFDLVVPE